MISLASLRSDRWTAWPEHVVDFIGIRSKFERPPDEWIIVPVPAIVSKETWALALQALERNRTKSTRNTRYDYLLVRLIICE